MCSCEPGERVVLIQVSKDIAATLNYFVILNKLNFSTCIPFMISSTDGRTYILQSLDQHTMMFWLQELQVSVKHLHPTLYTG